MSTFFSTDMGGIAIFTNPGSNRLSQARRTWASQRSEKMKKIYFQMLVDFQYLGLNLPLSKKQIIVNAAMRGGLGDAGQAFLCAEKIQRARPDYAVSVLLQCSFKSEADKVKQIFPTDEFSLEFFTNISEMEERMKKIRGENINLIGVAAPIGSGELYSYPLYQRVYEYGFKENYGFKNELDPLSMGFDDMEEGITFPTIEPRRLNELKMPWLREALGIHCEEGAQQYLQARRMYHMYLPKELWTMKMLSLYTIANIEKNSPQSIDVFLPLDYSLHQYIEWGALQTDELKKYGIGKLILVTPRGTECIELGEGKEMRILSNAIPTGDLDIIQQHSQPFFGCTGDMTVSKAIALRKVPFYGLLDHKDDFVRSWKDLAQKENKPHFRKLLELLSHQSLDESEIYKRNEPKQQMMWFQQEPSFDLADPQSIPRKSMSELAPRLTHFAAMIANLYSETPLRQETEALDALIQENYNFESRLIAMADRGMILSNYPRLLEIEKTLWEEFKRGTISEAQVVENLRAGIREFSSGI